MKDGTIVLEIPDIGPKLIISMTARRAGDGVDIIIGVRPERPATTLLGPATTIVNRFGGKKALAKHLGIPVNTIHSWMVKGVVPPKWHAPLITLGSKYGVPIMLADLIVSPHPVS